MSQKDDLLFYLEQRGSIDPKQAWQELGIYRLSARIKDLREEGHSIITNTPKGYAIYSFLKKNKPDSESKIVCSKV